jgi:hypothetical protein
MSSPLPLVVRSIKSSDNDDSALTTSMKIDTSWSGVSMSARFPPIGTQPVSKHESGSDPDQHLPEPLVFESGARAAAAAAGTQEGLQLLVPESRGFSTEAALYEAVGDHEETESLGAGRLSRGDVLRAVLPRAVAEPASRTLQKLDEMLLVFRMAKTAEQKAWDRDAQEADGAARQECDSLEDEALRQVYLEIFRGKTGRDRLLAEEDTVSRELSMAEQQSHSMSGEQWAARSSATWRQMVNARLRGSMKRARPGNCRPAEYIDAA